MKKGNYVLIIFVLCLLICLISTSYFFLNKNVTKEKVYYLEKINDKEIKTSNMNKEFVQNKKIAKN